MYLIPRFFKLSIVFILSLTLVGCTATYPKDFLKLSPDSLKYRQLQTKRYDTQNEEEIIAASAGVLQDLGFTLDDSETELGLVVGSKARDATDAGQVVLATFATLLGALGGSSSNAFEMIDSVQKIRVSIVTKPSLDGSKTLVRVTFQRIVWNKQGDISRMETLNDPELYQGFFERLSKSIFLEAHEI
ncbi:MAG: hypothetical protein ISS45_06210 [Candidatus Omnitrophica bacterium]|nr:hypothetical protein [Candidatus Omnitrophota bacterium]